MMQRYKEKLVLHIPHYAWENEQLVKIDYASFKEYLYEQLKEIGLISWYSADARGYYKGREYDEELLTVFCDEPMRDTIIEVFERTYFDLRDLMRQEAFAYECDGTLHVTDLQ